MYKIAVPMVNENVTRCTPENFYKEVLKFDAGRVFLALDRYEADGEKREKALNSLRENCRFFKERGYEVGAWIWAFMLSDSPFTPMKNLKGQVYPENMCPADENFLEFAASYVKDIASTGVDIIMYDDDLRYGFLGNEPCCICKNHLKMISSYLGEEVTEEQIYNAVHFGGKNKYRDAYIKANGEAFKSFARKMREAVDTVDPHIRMGACACMNSWDLDGVHAWELSKILAGKTKPFVRLIGAPYWTAVGAWGSSLQDTVELSRMERAWYEGNDIEIFAEGDVYPRPRTNCPASYLEGFDTAVRAAGCTDGILKYGLDYTSDADYETGYAAYHIRNRELYKEIDRIFSDKKHIGVRVYEYTDKLSSAYFSEAENVDELFFSHSARMLSYNTIPTVYEGDGLCGAVFGENARHIPLEKLKNGIITDIKGAKILSERGVETGIASFGERIKAGTFEIFSHNGNRIAAMGADIMSVSLRNEAEIKSYTVLSDSSEVPMSFYYENSSEQKFLVLNVFTSVNNVNVLRHYERGRQLNDAVLRFSGKPLPVSVSGYPALYMQCKENEKTLSVGLWNYFADIVFSPEIILGDEYKSCEFINCSGELKGNKLVLSDIAAFGNAFFCLEK